MLPWPAISTSPDLYLGKHISSLFASGMVGSWYDPSDLKTLFQDTGGTVPVTAAGQSVALMLDKSGLGHQLSQATSTARPILRKDANGYFYLEFDGLDDILSSSATYNVGPTHYLATAFLRPTINSLPIFGTFLSSTRYSRIIGVSTGDRVGRLYRTVTGSFSASSLGLAPINISKVFDSLVVPGYIDIGVNGAINSTTTISTTTESMPNSIFSVGPSDARFYGGVSLPVDPGAANRKIVQKYLASKYGGVL